MAQLRSELSRVLPEYMIPSALVRLKALPLTPNGKLDRKGLPLPDAAAYVARGYEAPQGETEQRLARLWAELLQLERVGREDNFFELGGHSLDRGAADGAHRHGLWRADRGRELIRSPDVAAVRAPPVRVATAARALEADPTPAAGQEDPDHRDQQRHAVLQAVAKDRQRSRVPRRSAVRSRSTRRHCPAAVWSRSPPITSS